MRIISQNGNADLPYERTIVMHANECVFAKCEGHDREIMLGKYSSIKKAYKAMEMLRKAYSPVIEINNIDCDSISSDILPSDLRVVPVSYGHPYIETRDNYYFRFPRDSEVEV